MVKTSGQDLGCERAFSTAAPAQPQERAVSSRTASGENAISCFRFCGGRVMFRRVLSLLVRRKKNSINRNHPSVLASFLPTLSRPCHHPTRNENDCRVPKAWAAATKAPVDRDPLGEDGEQQEQSQEQQQEQHERQRSSATAPLLSPSEFSLVLRPDIGGDEHLLPIHEGPWTPDGSAWFQAKISLLQGGPQPAATAVPTGAKGAPAIGGLEIPRSGGCRGAGGVAESEGLDQELGGGGGTGLSVTLRPEGEGQRRARLEGEAIAAMVLEDERSRRVGAGVSRLEREAAGKMSKAEEERRSSRLAAAVFAARVRRNFSSSTQIPAAAAVAAVVRRRKHSSESGDALRALGFSVLSTTNARGSGNWSLQQ